MQYYKALKEVLSSMVMAIVPVVIMAISQLLLGDAITSNGIIVTIIAYIICAVILFAINRFLPKVPVFRSFRKYEGCWIEIIPNFERTISICDFYFKDGTYHYDGVNFENDYKNPVVFKSIKFMENEDGFYYVTSTAQTVKYEGMGKVTFYKSGKNEVQKGKGFFIDVLNNPTISETIMLKFNKKFYNEYMPGIGFHKIKKMNKTQIYKTIKSLDIVINSLKTGVKNDWWKH